MHLDEPRLHPIARAYKFQDHTSIHGRSIQDDQVKVLIISVMEGQNMTPIPVRAREITNLGQAVYTFIVWPLKCYWGVIYRF